MHTAATGGTAGSAGSGLRAFGDLGADGPGQPVPVRDRPAARIYDHGPTLPCGGCGESPPRASAAGGSVGRTTASLAALAIAKPGLITVLMMCSRWSKGANALFIALMVSHSKSGQP